MLSASGSAPLAADDPRLSGFALFADSEVLVLAVSGGPDSMALLHFARAIAALSPARPRLIAATVDHGLRPESRAEAEMVAGWCASLRIPHRLLVWEGEKPRTRLQERAREARYDLLAACARAEGAQAVLTAHHADDQAETILFRLLRGSGPAGLAGMATVSQRDGMTVGRPLLHLRKAELVSFCRSAGQPFVEDPSNRDPRFARTRVRRLVRLLEAEGLEAMGLDRLARRAARAEAALAAATDELAKVIAKQGHVRALADAPVEIALRWLMREVAARTGRAPRLDRAEALIPRLLGALRAADTLVATLGGLVLRLDKAGNLCFLNETDRQRGRPRDSLR